ncbi:hypothetical protein N657DRAFT_672083 [Parathielavia appendiculata]|uniref:Uncharacterized protein n=1 Tax=Parathielavia appendiculata TaxID=2587402 RepID=A0AAN6Z2X7_9PEZI|nr:hypothetical protein N657DRAFT_672083 [Parathielavia appendiculata]
MDAESLLRILRAYDASVDASAVRAAVSGPNSTDIERWAAAHLCPDTLLTVDELNQYAALEDAGLAERLAMSSDLSAARVLSEREIKEAIDELNRSTQAISRHAETLKQQQQALDRLVDDSRKNKEERAAVEENQVRKWQTQRRDFASVAAELSQSLDSRIHELQRTTTKADGSIQQTVETLFRSDDKLLSSLQKLAWELETEDAEEQADVAVLRETCARLIKFTVEGIRTRLDRIYLESLELPVQSGSSSRVTADEVAALQAELESLYAEILPVAQMSTEQQFLEPALKSLAAKNGQRLARSALATSYLTAQIHDCLDYLIDRGQDLEARLGAFQAYRLAANAVLDIAESELDMQAAACTSEPASQKGATQQDAISPVRPRPKPRSRHSSGAPAIGEESPLEEILRTLAISLPQPEDEPVNVHQQIMELASTIASRRAKVQDVARNVQDTFESATTKQVADGKLAIQLVRDSILSETPFGEIRLVDPEIDGSITVLAQGLAAVDEKLKDVDNGMAKLRGKNLKRDELISRWGS